MAVNENYSIYICNKVVVLEIYINIQNIKEYISAKK